MTLNSCLLAFLFTLSTTLAASSFISDNVFESYGSTGRTLLQATKSCPVNFEFRNYTIITSQCKAPQYPPKLCCSALAEFACPYADQVNDPTTDCASTMFSYINLYGRYPPGLFASECKRGKDVISCDADAPAPAPAPAPAENANANKALTGRLVPHGKYPPGLFASECHKDGISCDAPAPAPAPAGNANGNGALIGRTVPDFLVLLAGSLVRLIQML